MRKLPSYFQSMYIKTTRLFKDFFESEKAGGLLLLLVTLVSLALANSPIQANYIGFWETEIGHHSITHWINDGLMTIFFLLIGLELELWRRIVYYQKCCFANFWSPRRNADSSGSIFSIQLGYGNTKRGWNSDGNRYCFCYWHLITSRESGANFIENILNGFGSY